MSDAVQRERERSHAQRLLGKVFYAPERAYTIHYALQRLRRDETDVASPIAAIAVRNLGTGRTRVFSIKSQADAAGIDLSAPLSPSRLLALEYSLLFNFNDFLDTHRDRLFVHWYMRDQRFGFQALENRYRTALANLAAELHGPRSAAPATAFGYTGGPPRFPVRIAGDNRVDLAHLLRQMFDIGPVGLRQLAQSNSLSVAELIDGTHEPAAFARGNHGHLEWSSATKARLIAEIATMAHNRTLQPLDIRRGSRGPSALRIFINYRREDTEAAANWLHEILSLRFGDENVFIDTDDIPAGIDFEAYLRSQIESCDVFLAMIGRSWSAATDATGLPRLANSNDFVRREIKAALSRGIPVIPVLVEGTPLPEENQLPPDLRPLRRRQSVELRSRDFRQDVERLVVKISEAHRLGRQIGAQGLA
jgi:hypothetical protein